MSTDPVQEFRWPVSASRSIAASSEEVWRVVSMPGNLELAHPYCLRNPVQHWPGAESRDEVHYLSGWVYERRFTDWHEGAGYDLEIGGQGEPKSFVTWRIAGTGQAAATLTITVYPHVLQSIPLVVRWLPHIAYVRPMLRRYLQSVVRGFEWFITRDEPVPRNQFGTHPWFSAGRAR